MTKKDVRDNVLRVNTEIRNPSVYDDIEIRVKKIVYTYPLDTDNGIPNGVNVDVIDLDGNERNINIMEEPEVVSNEGERLDELRNDVIIPVKDDVNRPSHYTYMDPTYEPIKVIEAWKLDYHLGNVTKYISRAGIKNPEKEIEDLEKARWYLDRKIYRLKDEKVYEVDQPYHMN